MAKKDQCEWYDFIDDKPSELHKELIRREGRPTGNYLYALYKTSDIAEKMDEEKDSDGNLLYKRNNQGQHDARDILKFIDWGGAHRESLDKAAINIGAKDARNNPIDYTDAYTALKNAEDLNDTRKHLIANVYKHGDVYNIIVSERTSRNFTQADEVKSKIKLYDFYKQAFAASGIDITNVPKGLENYFSAFNGGLARYLQSIKRSELRYMLKDDALMILFLNQDSPHTQRAINAFGSMEDAAQAVLDYNRGTGSFTNGQLTLLKRAMENGKTFPNLDLDAIQEQAENISKNIREESGSEDIKQELHRLNKKYHIDFNECHKVNSRIESLSDAAVEAVLAIERQIRLLEKQEGTTEEGRRLSRIKDNLLRELASKKYYSGVMGYLKEASSQLNYNPETNTSIMDDIIREAELSNGTELEKIMKKAKAFQQVKQLKERYYPLVAALANDLITIDESISEEDINNIRSTAKALKSLFDKQFQKEESKEEDLIADLLHEIIGDETPDGIAVYNAVKAAFADSSAFDKLYSMGRASNPVVAAMGSIIRKAQDKRTLIMKDWALRTRRATDKLYKSGSNSEFMYEDDGHIASPYDWTSFEKAKFAYIRGLKKQSNLDDWEYKQLVENWIKTNTEEIIVDEKSGRTERVPNINYRKPRDFQEGWTREQKEYYNTMMQIKGEIGTLLPSYAQHQFLPPQVRRGMLDAVGNAKSLTDVFKAIKNKFQNIYKIREDDTEFNRNGIVVEGQEMAVVESDFDNTEIKQIPIFFVNRVEQGELLKDFSGALSHLAGTAANYSAMSEVVDVVEFMGDYIKSRDTKDNQSKSDVVGNKFFKIIKDVKKAAGPTNTSDLVDSFIDQHFYGVKLDHNQVGYKWAKSILSLISYTSFRALSTNWKGMVSNVIVAEFQMMVEAGAGEFYGFKNFMNAHSKLFGDSGTKGEISELLTNNMNHKSTLFREKFDPMNDTFDNMSNTRYYKSTFRQLISHDCSFIGYGAGEYLVHYVNMYSILDAQKVLLDGKKISLYDAYEVVNKKDENSELKLKEDVTTLEGEPINEGGEFEQLIRNRIRYCNQTCHGSMNSEDKGIIHQYLLGRAIMNLRQWAVEHYSRRFRKRHFDYSLGTMREGYWHTWFNYMFGKETKEEWNTGLKGKAKVIALTAGEITSFALPLFIKDYIKFNLRGQAQWNNLTEDQKYNIRRVQQEMNMFIILLCISFGLGDSKDHKKDFWRRFAIYQTKRLLLEVEASTPTPGMVQSVNTMINSPMAVSNTITSLLYLIHGVGDIGTPIEKGPYNGEDKYWRNFKKYWLPGIKDWEQLQSLDEDETLFNVFNPTPTGR